MSELEVYRPGGEVAAREPQRDIDSWIQVVSDVIKIANVICDTPFVPDGLRGSAPAVAAAILSGREMGLGMMTSLANIDVIKGKPTQKPLLMRALILSRGHKWLDVDVTDTRAVVRGCRKGESEWTEVTFTADQMRKAGVDLGKYPADKLYARASSRLAKRKFADVIMGMPYTPEDMEDDDDGFGTVTETASPAAIEQPRDKPRTARRNSGRGVSLSRQMERPAPSPDASPAHAATPLAAPAVPVPQDAGEALPPLPGEEDPAPAVPDETAPSGPAAGAGPTRAASSSAARDHSPQGTGPQSPSSPDGSANTPDDTGYDTAGTVTPLQIQAIWTVLSQVFNFTKEEKEQARIVCGVIAGRDLESTKHLSRNQAKAILDTLALWQDQAARAGEHPRDYLIAMMAAQDAAVPGE